MTNLFGKDGGGGARPGELSPPTDLLQPGRDHRDLSDLTMRTLSRNAWVGVAQWRSGFEGTFHSNGRLVFVTIQRGVLDFPEIGAQIGAGEAVILGSRRPVYKVRSTDATAAAIFAISRRTFIQHVRTRYDDEMVTAATGDCVVREKAELSDSAIRLSFQFAELLEGAVARRLGDMTSEAVERALSFYLYEASLSAHLNDKSKTSDMPQPRPRSQYIVRPQSVRAAEEFISENFADIDSVEQIAHASNVSIRTLRRGFRAFLDVGPMEYVRDKRLRTARAALKNIDDTRPVRDIAESVGFRSYSAFWAQYNEAYQESPSQTRRLVRKSASRMDDWQDDN